MSIINVNNYTVDLTLVTREVVKLETTNNVNDIIKIIIIIIII